MSNNTFTCNNVTTWTSFQTGTHLNRDVRTLQDTYSVTRLMFFMKNGEWLISHFMLPYLKHNSFLTHNQHTWLMKLPQACLMQSFRSHLFTYGLYLTQTMLAVTQVNSSLLQTISAPYNTYQLRQIWTRYCTGLLYKCFLLLLFSWNLLSMYLILYYVSKWPEI